jgi:hypothetical protein
LAGAELRRPRTPDSSRLPERSVFTIRSSDRSMLGHACGLFLDGCTSWLLLVID